MGSMNQMLAQPQQEMAPQGYSPVVEAEGILAQHEQQEMAIQFNSVLLALYQNAIEHQSPAARNYSLQIAGDMITEMSVAHLNEITAQQHHQDVISGRYDGTEEADAA